MLTEEEAKERWCPFSRVLEGEPPGAAGVNRAGPRADYTCIASECMAWRKTGSKCRNRRGQYVDRDVDATGAWIEVGFCGLAGRPE
jgi:hypothetical protein